MTADRQAGAKRRAYRRGHWAEAIAAWFLRGKGYRVLARRYVTPVGEIDLVVRRGRTVAFVEVKARAGWALAAYALTPQQRRRIVRAALHWQQKSAASDLHDFRFDVILINRFGLPRHLVHAFAAD